MKPLTVYIAASFRQLHAVRLFHEVLRERIPGIQILDWTERVTPPECLTPAERRQWFGTEQQYGQVYRFCRDSCVNADLLICFGAYDQDVAAEVGMASATGVPVLGICDTLEVPGTMLYGAVDMWMTDVEHALRCIAHVATCVCPDALLCADNACGFLAVCPRGRTLAQEVQL